MPEDKGQPNPSSKPTRRNRLRKWWTDRTPNNLWTLILGIAAGLLVLALATVASLLLHFFGSSSGHVSGYVLIAVACASLAIGGLATWWLTRNYYRLRVHAAEVEREREQAKLTELASD